jgi:hypothetical protein
MRDTKDYDPYKRCKMPVFVAPGADDETRADACFCKTHGKKLTNGRVDNRLSADTKLYEYYMKKNPDFEQINEENVVVGGTYSEFGTSDFDAVLRKIEKQNLKKQRIEVMDHSDQISLMLTTMSIADIPASISRSGDTVEVAKEWKDYLKRKNKWQLTLRESESIVQHLVGLLEPKKTVATAPKKKPSISSIAVPAKEEVKEEEKKSVEPVVLKKIHSISAEDMDEYLENGNIQSITLSISGHKCDFYLLPNHTGKDELTNPFLLYTQYKKDKSYQHCGYAREWVDSTDEIPDRFKNAQHYVLDPDTRLHALEVDIHTRGAMISTIPKGTYREFKYDDDIDELVNNGAIRRND